MFVCCSSLNISMAINISFKKIISNPRRAGSWSANQPATWLEYIASDLPVPIALQILGLVAAAVLAARLLYLTARAVAASACTAFFPGRKQQGGLCWARAAGWLAAATGGVDGHLR